MKKLMIATGILSVLASTVALAGPSLSPPLVLQSGMVSVAAGQTARINVLNTGSKACTVVLGFADKAGAAVATSDALTVAPSSAVNYDFTATAAGGVSASITPTAPASPPPTGGRESGYGCKSLVPTLEVLAADQSVSVLDTVFVTVMQQH